MGRAAVGAVLLGDLLERWDDLLCFYTDGSMWCATPGHDALSPYPTEPAQCVHEASFQGKSESRGWKYARFRNSLPGYHMRAFFLLG